MNNQGCVGLYNNVAAHSIGMAVLLSVTLIAIRVIINNNLYYVQTCTTNEMDKISDWLHMHSTYSNG